MKEFIKKFVDEEVSLWSLDDRDGVIEMLEDFLKALQKAKQKEAIEQSTNWQMKEEQPELSTLTDLFKEWLTDRNLVSDNEIELAEDFCTYIDSFKDKELISLLTDQQPELTAEEFLRSKMEKEDLKDYFADFYLGISGKRYYMKDLLTEFKNQNG